MAPLLIAGIIWAGCTAATGKGHDYVVYTARRGADFSRVQVTLPLDKVCVTRIGSVSKISLVNEASLEKLISFDFGRSGGCRKPGAEILQELFDNGTDYMLVAEREKGPDLRMPLLDRDPLTGQDV